MLQSGSVTEARRFATVELHLSELTPWKIETLAEPMRVSVAIRGAEAGGLDAQDLGERGRKINGLRLVEQGEDLVLWLDLAQPMLVDEAEMRASPDRGGSVLRLRLKRASAADFAEATHTPTLQDSTPRLIEDAQSTGSRRVIVLDPGHGGHDPGAHQGGMREADLVLLLAFELANALAQSDAVEVVLTRSDDSFVPLERRVSIARAAGASALISLHADALEAGGASGASTYTLARDEQDAATRRTVALHQSHDIITGLDFDGLGDDIPSALVDLARADALVASESLATQILDGFAAFDVPLHTKPRRNALFAVLTAADFASVLVEVGFLSNLEDRNRLATREGRASVVAALARALEAWVASEARRRSQSLR